MRPHEPDFASRAWICAETNRVGVGVVYGTGATWIGPCDCLRGAHSCISILMPPKHKERKKVARTVPAKAKREGSQQDSSLMVVRSDRGKAKKKQKPICYWGGLHNAST